MNEMKIFLLAMGLAAIPVLAAAPSAARDYPFCRKGEAGPGGTGDAIITIEIRAHPFFTQDGHDVRLNLPITIDEAMNGAKVKVRNGPFADRVGTVDLVVKAGEAVTLPGRSVLVFRKTA